MRLPLCAALGLLVHGDQFMASNFIKPETAETPEILKLSFARGLRHRLSTTICIRTRTYWTVD